MRVGVYVGVHGLREVETDIGGGGKQGTVTSDVADDPNASGDGQVERME